MVSSRSNQKFLYKGNPDALLSDIRKDMADAVEQQTMFDESLFDVWINERAPAADGARDLWEECLDQVRRADLLIALYNGDAGWAKKGGEIGICHAELQQALNTAAAKVRILQLAPVAALRKGQDGVRDNLFRDYVDRQHAFTGAPCMDGEALIALCRKTIREAVAQMVHLGLREARKGKFYSGDALDWSHLDFRHRQAQMSLVLREGLEGNGAAELETEESIVPVRIGDREILVRYSAIPGPFSIAEAREGVNQIFLRDHQLVPHLNNRRPGPLHVVACHRSFTESQALRQLGLADATVVSAPFGIYLADEIQKVQMMFLVNCRDRTTTLYEVQRMFDWIDQAGEAPQIVEKAAARARIVQAIAKEQTPVGKHA